MAIHRFEGDPSAVPISVHGSVQLVPFVTALTTSGFDIRFDRDTGSLLIREAAGEARRAAPAVRKAPVASDRQSEQKAAPVGHPRGGLSRTSRYSSRAT